MTTKLSWRLSKLPTPSELTELVREKIITQEEAKEILLSTVEDRDTESLKEEITFLRELVERLSKGTTKVIEVIREVRNPWNQYQWYQPYWTWCGGNTSNGITNAINANVTLGSGATTSLGQAFSNIKTF